MGETLGRIKGHAFRITMASFSEPSLFSSSTTITTAHVTVRCRGRVGPLAPTEHCTGSHCMAGSVRGPRFTHINQSYEGGFMGQRRRCE